MSEASVADKSIDEWRELLIQECIQLTKEEKEAVIKYALALKKQRSVKGAVDE